MNALKDAAEQKWCGSVHQVLSALGNLISVAIPLGCSQAATVSQFITLVRNLSKSKLSYGKTYTNSL